ncbi:MAG TPA: hypothetical protein VL947_07300 [Cytophagales bacterium]|nr:hypothetical protein [Cytophagales bacterium]
MEHYLKIKKALHRNVGFKANNERPQVVDCYINKGHIVSIELNGEASATIYFTSGHVDTTTNVSDMLRHLDTSAKNETAQFIDFQPLNHSTKVMLRVSTIVEIVPHDDFVLIRTSGHPSSYHIKTPIDDFLKKLIDKGLIKIETLD